MLKTTPLHAEHRRAGARLVDFSGWEMPLHYNSQIAEHHAVRQDAGMFDVSHMNPVDVSGSGARDFLRVLLANNIDRLKQEGNALYSCMLNEQGGIVDDIIVYYIAPQTFRLILNAATHDKDMAWLAEQATPFSVQIDERSDLAIISVQGPNAVAKAQNALTLEQRKAVEPLKHFQCVMLGDWLIATTGYTGEQGYEIILPGDDAPSLWNALAESGIMPCGLGARDTLRLEAGMKLYGADMDETTSPYESALGWTVAWEPDDRPFLGREALVDQHHNGTQRVEVCLVLESGGVLRAGQAVFANAHEVGVITSGGFSPTLKKSIGFARVSANDLKGCTVKLRGRQLPVQIVKPPFYRGKK